jgi:hypothetical protein
MIITTYLIGKGSVSYKNIVGDVYAKILSVSGSFFDLFKVSTRYDLKNNKRCIYYNKRSCILCFFRSINNGYTYSNIHTQEEINSLIKNILE